jgi:hypothetical protein
LSWEGLEALGKCTVYERTPPAQVVERVGDAELVLTNKTILTREQIRAWPAPPLHRCAGDRFTTSLISKPPANALSR